MPEHLPTPQGLIADEAETILRSMQFAGMRISLDAFIDLFSATVPTWVITASGELTDCELREVFESTYIRVVHA